MLDAIDRCARALRADAPAFTRRNLLYAVRRACSNDVAEEVFDSALRERLARGAIQGLLRSPCSWTPRRLPREWDAYFPKAVLLIDRPAILDLFVASGALATARLAVVCIDGSPAPIAAWLRRGFRAGRRAPVLYLHDAATVAYPFTFEPLATAVRHGTEPVAFRDLGLPPNGLPSRRFHDRSLPARELVFDLEAIPPAALVAYAVRCARRAVPGDPNMLPLARDLAAGGQERARS
jgi:hypothetical protein